MKKTSVVLGALVLVAGILAVYLWQDLRTQRRQGAELASRVTALESVPPVTAPPEVAAAPQAAAAPAPGPGALETPSPAAAPPAVAQAAAPAKESGKAATAPMLEAMLSAEGQDYTRTMLRTVMDQMYPDAAEVLGLSAEETGKLFDLLSMQEGTLSADTLALMAGGADPAARRELQRKVVEEQRAQQRELAALLGSKYPKWEEYQGTAAARQQVEQLRTTLASSGTPLSQAQVDSLTRAFAREQSRFARDEREWMNSPAAIDSPNMMQETTQRTLQEQRKLVDTAAPHLDSAQLAQFRRQVEQQERMLQAMMGMMGAGAAQ